MDKNDAGCLRIAAGIVTAGGAAIYGVCKGVSYLAQTHPEILAQAALGAGAGFTFGIFGIGSLYVRTNENYSHLRPDDYYYTTEDDDRRSNRATLILTAAGAIGFPVLMHFANKNHEECKENAAKEMGMKNPARQDFADCGAELVATDSKTITWDQALLETGRKPAALTL